MTQLIAPQIEDVPPTPKGSWKAVILSIRHDRLAMAAAIYLIVLAIILLVGAVTLQEMASQQALRQRNLPPGSLQAGWQFILGSDSLGRSVLARIIVGGSRTLGVAISTVAVATLIGTIIGTLAGYKGGLADALVMRVADVSLAFPGILLAVVLLYIFPPMLWTVIIVLVINRLPLYIRVARAETLEVRERLFVAAARVLGAKTFRITTKHILPIIFPTILTVATLDLAVVMLVESSLSFLGMGVQPPSISWGLLVADGRRYLRAAWWLTFYPGLAIVITGIAISLVSNWLRVALDPVQSARLYRQEAETAAPEEAEDAAH
ncbi:MAG TPA: ABC transporter permease [Devosiaceae bacterium]|jgi:peptide/nickel transport system permease protein